MDNTTERKVSQTDTVISDFQRRITDAFEIFDHEANKTVDVREVGTIIRSLGCCPSEADLHNILTEIEDEESTGYIRFEKFLPVMTKVLVERRYRPVPEDKIVAAFRVLDTEGRGYLLQDELSKYMTEEGEPFTEEELEEMTSQAYDVDKGHIPYKDYASLMAAEEA